MDKALTHSLAVVERHLADLDDLIAHEVRRLNAVALEEHTRQTHTGSDSQRWVES